MKEFSDTEFLRRPILIVFILLAIFINGCKETPTALQVTIPSIYNVTIHPNPNNVVSAIVGINITKALFGFVEYGTDTSNLRSTPVFLVASESVTVPTLGLHAGTSYFIRGGAVSQSGDVRRSAFQMFTTDSLPADFPKFSKTFGSTPLPGYVMFGFTSNTPERSYATIIDNDANVVMYRPFDDAIVDFQKQPNGMYTAWSSLNGSLSHFYEFDALGNITREFEASTVDETGPHEIRIRGERHALFGIELRTMDLTSLGGRADALVRGIRIEYHRSPSNLFVWNTFDHFSVADAAPDISLTGANVNPWHGNAIEIDTDKNLLVSFRNLDEVTKIDVNTGEILWRLGGKQNQFIFIGDPLNGFSHQHGIRRLRNGNIILFDNGNGHNPPTSRAVEYRLDETAKTATLVWEYRGEPVLYSFAIGFAQRLPYGNTLICFGIAQKIIEVNMDGEKQWELSIMEPNKLPYRAFRIDSLY